MTPRSKLRRRAALKRRRGLTPHQAQVRREARALGHQLLLMALDVLEGDSVEHAMGKAKARVQRLSDARKAGSK